MVGDVRIRWQIRPNRHLLLRKGDPAGDDARLLQSKLTGVTIGTELAQVGGVVAGEVRALIDAILFGTGG